MPADELFEAFEESGWQFWSARLAWPTKEAQPAGMMPASAEIWKRRSERRSFGPWAQRNLLLLFVIHVPATAVWMVAEGQATLSWYFPLALLGSALFGLYVPLGMMPPAFLLLVLLWRWRDDSIARSRPVVVLVAVVLITGGLSAELIALNLFHGTLDLATVTDPSFLPEIPSHGLLMPALWGAIAELPPVTAEAEGHPRRRARVERE